MKNETKLKKLMGWLDKNNIEYRCPSKEISKCKRKKRSDLFIPKFVISVRIDDDYTQKWYRAHYDRNPVVIRDTDTPRFLIEKMQNCEGGAVVKDFEINGQNIKLGIERI